MQRILGVALAVALRFAEASSDELHRDDECIGEACTLSMLQKRNANYLQSEDDAEDPGMSDNQAGADHQYMSSDSMVGVPDSSPLAPAAVAKNMEKAAREKHDEVEEKANKQPNSKEADNVYHTNDGMAGVPDVPGAPAAAIKIAKKEDKAHKQANTPEADHTYKSSDGMEGVPDLPGAPAAAKAEFSLKNETKNAADNTAAADHKFNSSDSMVGVPDVPGAPGAAAAAPAPAEEPKKDLLQTDELADEEDEELSSEERDLMLEDEMVMDFVEDADGEDFMEDMDGEDFMEDMDEDYEYGYPGAYPAKDDY
mmetsp:Transcript_62504/g.111069  ORF Transcript_62504/g.111069 Transcript_62504/m.111069 type:complete len:311 (+) Transcript_62504:80-1012(+)|eukprot:CAMPEP_0197663238 /NCGR_PEP_ID=MMETSP1338-20131121/56658_1 /TAXON_ID=43686 ORGANISM="Pelagodinium beii, Strain RCC1491" /NCGR_SAMPLE_ID=MMETSP1338 /ASSEMBLY_ACC=CAM_ASM_000754 /LENGTH=310 /DNA_ID=CAMNT_0043241507 /DNA_START=52 /DNA_END=984 /DNA_ORIENTATION=-